ncbi:hypothetical protein MHBO_004235 [Bonamia ostreae]|uniref:Peptidase M14 domain-containing protein n=1 Tax=Bonamia ostreae TaxID=126728 RepID=A0ABV2ASS3_9EUKA
MVQVRKNVLPLDSGLEVVHHPMDLKKAVQRTKAAASENNRFHSRFHQYDEILNFYSRVERDINRIEGMHCEKRTFGKTTSGEEMIALKIWRDSEIVQNRPKFLMLGGMHSREWVGISTNLMLVAKFEFEFIDLKVLRFGGSEVSENSREKRIAFNSGN